MKMNSPKDLNMLEEASTQTYVKTLIDIGEQYERWCAVRTLVLQTLTVVDFLNADEKTAAALLDIYDATVLQASAKQHGAKTVKSIATQTEEEIVPHQQALYNRTDDSQQKETTSRPSYKLHAHNNVSILSKDAVKSESGLTVHTEYAIPSLSESPPIVKVEPCDFDLPIEFTDNQNASGQTEVDSSETIPVHVQPTGIYENQLASASNTLSSITGPTSVQMAEVKPDNHYFEDMSSEEDIDEHLQTKRAKGRPRSKRCKAGEFGKMTAKERMRKYRERIKNNPVRHAEYLENERQRWKRRKQSGKVKSVKDLSETEAREQRRLWRQRWKSSQQSKRRKK